MAGLTESYPQFFTATILEWKPLLAENRYKDIIIESLRFLVQRKRVLVYGFVIMPNHIHLIWQMAAGYKREDVQRDFMKFTAQKMRFDLLDTDPQQLQAFVVDAKDRKCQFWERNALSIDLYNHKTFIQKLYYIHSNPLQPKWQLSNQAEDYPYSSARFYETGIDNWGFLSHYAD